MARGEVGGPRLVSQRNLAFAGAFCLVAIVACLCVFTATSSDSFVEQDLSATTALQAREARPVTKLMLAAKWKKYDAKKFKDVVTFLPDAEKPKKWRKYKPEEPKYLPEAEKGPKWRKYKAPATKYLPPAEKAKKWRKYKPMTIKFDKAPKGY